MNVVMMVGEVTDRPFRPGDGERVVVKLRVHNDERRRFDDVEFDSFGRTGQFAEGLWRGDWIAVRGRLEGRVVDGFDEIKIVANHVELVRKAGDARNSARHRDDDHRDDHDHDHRDDG